jgi:hypothetical protein
MSIPAITLHAKCEPELMSSFQATSSGVFSVGNGPNYLVPKETIPLKNVSFYISIPQKGEQRVLDIWEYTTFHYNTNTLCSPIYGIYI